MKRPVILTFTAHYLPGYKAGGPIRTIASMVEQLGDEFDFRIVTTDRDLGDNEPFVGLERNTWVKNGKARVFYQTSGSAGRKALNDSLKSENIDLIYLNSLFHVQSAIMPLLRRRFGGLPSTPVLLAPRGQLSLGALEVGSKKKRTFLRLAEAFGLYRDVVFHASSEFEARDIQRELGNKRVMIALDLSEKGSPSLYVNRLEKSGDVLRVVFLSRISPKKNLLGALKILKGVSIPLSFDIYGPLEDEDYWARCEKTLEELPQNICVRYRRELVPEEVEGVLAKYDLFFFPTLGENYGHVIREALSAGLPTLISDQTPWCELDERNAGATLALSDPHAFIDWIEMFSRLSLEQREAMREAARAYGNDEEKALHARETNRAMLRSIVSGA